MQSGNNIHVQQHKANMINEEWNRTQTDALLSPFMTCMLSRLFCQVKWQMCRVEKQVLTTSTNLSQICFLGTTPVLTLDMRVNDDPKVDARSQESNSGPLIVRPRLYLLTMDTTHFSCYKPF